MSYFKVIVDKDKFSLYDTSKDKYYVVEPNDIDHILNPDNPYNDDGTLNLLSYSDVINYFNRKYSKRKPTKGYTAKKANLKKEYSDVAKLNRRGEISKKIQSINISDENKRMIEKYPIAEVVDILNITPNQKAAIRNILNDSNFKLDKAETDEIKQEFIKDKSLDIQKKSTQDQMNAMNLNQLNNAAQLNQIANNQAAELQNINNELARNRVNVDNRLQNLAANQQAQNNQLILYNNAFQNYQRNMAAQLMQMDNNFDQYIRNLQADIQALPDGAAIQNAINNANWMGNIQNALTNINNSIAALPKTADVRAIQDHVDRINEFFKQLPSAEQMKQIQGDVNQMHQKLLEMNIPNNAEQLEEINTSVNNLNNAIRAIKYPDYTQNLNEINQKIGLLTVHNNMIEHRDNDVDELQTNRNDNIAQATENNGVVNNNAWTDNLKLPVDALRHHTYNGSDISVPHSIMRLINILPSVNHNLKIHIDDMSGDNQYMYDIKPFGDKKLEFNIIQDSNAPFANLLHDAITSRKEWTADELVNYVTKYINENASSNDIASKPKKFERRSNTIKWHFDDADPMDDKFYNEDIIKFATLLPSRNRTIKYDNAKNFGNTFTNILNQFIDPNQEQDHFVKLNSNRSFDTVGKYIYDNLTTKIFANPVVGFETEGDDIFSAPTFQPLDDASPETVRSDVEKVTTGIIKSYIKLYPGSDEMSKNEFRNAAEDYVKNLTDETAPGNDLTYHYGNNDIANKYGRPTKGVNYSRAKNANHIIEHMYDTFNRGTWDDLLANYKMHAVEYNHSSNRPNGDKMIRPISMQNTYGTTDQNNVYYSDENFAKMAYRSMNSNNFRNNPQILEDDGDLDYSSFSEEGFGGRVANILSNTVRRNRFKLNPFNNNGSDSDLRSSDGKIVSILMKKF